MEWCGGINVNNVKNSSLNTVYVFIIDNFGKILFNQILHVTECHMLRKLTMEKLQLLGNCQRLPEVLGSGYYNSKFEMLSYIL